MTEDQTTPVLPAQDGNAIDRLLDGQERVSAFLSAQRVAMDEDGPRLADQIIGLMKSHARKYDNVDCGPLIAASVDMEAVIRVADTVATAAHVVGGDDGPGDAIVDLFRERLAQAGQI